MRNNRSVTRRLHTSIDDSAYASVATALVAQCSTKLVGDINTFANLLSLHSNSTAIVLKLIRRNDYDRDSAWKLP